MCTKNKNANGRLKIDFRMRFLLLLHFQYRARVWLKNDARGEYLNLYCSNCSKRDEKGIASFLVLELKNDKLERDSTT